MDKIVDFGNKHWKGLFLTLSIIATIFSFERGLGWLTILICVALILVSGIIFVGKEDDAMELGSEQLGKLLSGLVKTMIFGNGLAPGLFLDGGILFVIGMWVGGPNGINIASIGAVMIIAGLVSIPAKYIYKKKG